MSEKQTQEQRILARLRQGGFLTPLDALKEFNCFRLAARIHALRAQGYKIGQKMAHKNGKYFAKYWLSN